MRTGFDTIGEVVRRPRELQQEMREDIPICGASLLYSPSLYIVVVVLYMYREYYLQIAH